MWALFPIYYTDFFVEVQYLVTKWWRGQGSNLCSPSGRQFYRLFRLTTPAPLHESLSGCGHSPRGESNPLTYRLQIGCAAIALLGHNIFFLSAANSRQPYYYIK